MKKEKSGQDLPKKEQENNISDISKPQAEDTEKSAKSKLKKPLTAVLIAVLIAVIGVGGWGLSYCIYQYMYESTGSNSIVADDIYVNDVALGGMTMDEAREAITGIEEEMAAQVKVDVTAGDQTLHLTEEEFPCSFDSDEVFEQIREYSAEKGFDKEEQRYQITMTTDTSAIDSIAEKLAQDIYVEPVDARVKKFKPSADNMFTYPEE